MGDVVNLQGASGVNLAENIEFVADCCRYREEIMDEAAVRKKWKFDAATWERLGSDDELIAAVEVEQVRRIRTGQRKRERAQKLVVAAPDVVAKIMMDDNANARHRIDASKALDDFASKEPEAAAAAEASRFIISINLNGDIEHFNKSVAVCADDVVPNDGKPAPQRTLPVADKRWDSDGGCNDVVAAPPGKKTAKMPVKMLEHESAGVEERKTPEQIALESMMRY